MGKTTRPPIRKHSEADYYTFQCRHFTGIHQDVCKAGIRYDTVRDHQPGYHIARWPCISVCFGEEAATVCAQMSRYTPEESAAMVKRDDERLAALLADLANDRCPVCHQAVTKQQVGSCVYGSCGHRMYQGKA